MGWAGSVTSEFSLVVGEPQLAGCADRPSSRKMAFEVGDDSGTVEAARGERPVCPKCRILSGRVRMLRKWQCGGSLDFQDLIDRIWELIWQRGPPCPCGAI